MITRDVRRRANNALGASAIAFTFAAEAFVTSRLQPHPATPLILTVLIGVGICAGALSIVLYRRARAAEAMQASQAPSS